MTHIKTAEDLMDETSPGMGDNSKAPHSPAAPEQATETPMAKADRLRHRPGAVFWTSVGLIGAFTAWASLAPENLSAVMTAAMNWVAESVGWSNLVVTRGCIDREPRQGPFIVQDVDGTTVVPPDATVYRDAMNNLRITFN